VNSPSVTGRIAARSAMAESCWPRVEITEPRSCPFTTALAKARLMEVPKPRASLSASPISRRKAEVSAVISTERVSTAVMEISVA